MLEQEKNTAPVILTAEETATLTAMQTALKKAFTENVSYLQVPQHAQAAAAAAESYVRVTTLLGQSRKGPL